MGIILPIIHLHQQSISLDANLCKIFKDCWKIENEWKYDDMGQWMDTWTKVSPTSLGIQPMKKLGQMGQLLNLENWQKFGEDGN